MTESAQGEGEKRLCEVKTWGAIRRSEKGSKGKRAREPCALAALSCRHQQFRFKRDSVVGWVESAGVGVGICGIASWNAKARGGGFISEVSV
jgi:hypothetical protein